MNLFSTSHNPKKKLDLNFTLQLLFILIFIFLSACSSSKRFTEDKNTNTSTITNTNIESGFIRVLLEDETKSLSINVDSQVLLYTSEKTLAIVKSSNKLSFKSFDNAVKISISDKEFDADTFWIKSADDDLILRVDNKKYRGTLKIFISGSQIKVVNQVGLEGYIKGVMTREMPIGKGNDNDEALKAFSICVRTYALTKISEGKLIFDIYPDTRDQIYGGVDAENPKTNDIVDETRGMILSYNNSPAIIFYHACCGGRTEDVKNVFSNNDLPYLKSVEDGDGPFCSIAPKFNWREEYSEELFISRLYEAKLITSKNFRIKNITVASRFNSGRVNELDIFLENNDGDNKTVSIFGNNIRNIIRTANGSSILRSTMFEISVSGNKKVIISGKGFGHGVGFCQWGAIGQSRQGIDFLTILNHYFPGTKVINYYD